MAKISLELSVKVLLTVDLIDERVQANTILAVLVEEEDTSCIGLICPELAVWDGNMMIPKCRLSEFHRRTIELIASNFDSTEVEEAFNCG